MLIFNGDILKVVKFNESLYGRTIHYIKDLFSRNKVKNRVYNDKKNISLENISNYISQKMVKVVDFHDVFYPDGKVNKLESVVTVKDVMSGKIFNIYDNKLIYKFLPEKNEFYTYVNQVCF